MDWSWFPFLLGIGVGAVGTMLLFKARPTPPKPTTTYKKR